MNDDAPNFLKRVEKKLPPVFKGAGSRTDGDGGGQELHFTKKRFLALSSVLPTSLQP